MEIRIVIKSYERLEQELQNCDDIKTIKSVHEKFNKEPYEVFIDGKKQLNVSRFAIDLPLKDWGKDGLYQLDKTGWKYILEKRIDCM